MKRLRPNCTASKHSLVAFALTVALAFVASVTQLWPDVTAQSADALSGVPEGLDLVLLDAGIK